MKRLYTVVIIIFVFCSWLHIANAQDIFIPDPNLEATLRELFADNNVIGPNEPITRQHMELILHLDIRDRNIKDLTGLEYAVNIERLVLSLNQISDLSPIAGLTRLKRFVIIGNQVNDINSLTRLTQLEILDMGHNHISDLSPLTELKQLKVLVLNNNQISNVSPLTRLMQLEVLDLGINQISDISPITGLTQLEALDLRNNQISDVSPLKRLTLLEWLALHNNRISDVNPLVELIQLTELWLLNNNISDISPLASLVNLETLALAGNPITDTSPLANLPKLVNVDVQITVPTPTDIVEIPDPNLAAAVRSALGIAPNAEITTQMMLRLTELNVSRGSQIKDLTGLEHATQLTRLFLWENQISNIQPLAQLEKLNLLRLDGNQIVDLQPLTGLKQLNRLFLAANQISDLRPLESLTQLTALALSGNQVSDVQPLRNMRLLDVLWLDNNQISDVSPLVGLVNLESLVLAGNPITDTAQLRTILHQNPNLQIDIEVKPLTEDVNNDWIVNIQDLVLVAISLGEIGQNTSDVNSDEIVDIRDLVQVAGALSTSTSAPSLISRPLSIFTVADVQKWLSQAQRLNLTDVASQRGIYFLQQLLTTLMPKTTSLLPNYPNPFNPETWIPYQLAKPADVTITIYAANGQRVRQMPLGHQDAGSYQSKNRAVYWDGRNAIGEPVASGIYFYTLMAGDFTATRKMLITK